MKHKSLLEYRNAMKKKKPEFLRQCVGEKKKFVEIFIGNVSEIKLIELEVGESKKFDVNSDNYYDMSVTLTSIEASRANVVILAINEAVPASEASSGAATTDAAASQAASNEGSTACRILPLCI